jgi:hypothetical protein
MRTTSEKTADMIWMWIRDMGGLSSLVLLERNVQEFERALLNMAEGIESQGKHDETVSVKRYMCV